MEVRHPSFMGTEYIALARRHGVATVFADSDDYPSFADVTGDFVYARLMRCEAGCETGYPAPAIAAWAERAMTWRTGGEAAGLPRVEPAGASSAPVAPAARDVFLFFISGAKERAPSAAGRDPRSARPVALRRLIAPRPAIALRPARALASEPTKRPRLHAQARPFSDGLGRYAPRLRPNRKVAMARMMKTTNRILAMPAAPAAMPPKPNSAAISAITKNTTA
jgi:hypothetical protein